MVIAGISAEWDKSPVEVVHPSNNRQDPWSFGQDPVNAPSGTMGIRQNPVRTSSETRQTSFDRA
ncbi:putative protein OS=Streptomyces aurantiogriseus OX=66870 GN=GCM10010251_70110 PE=4 SV=1 [Streptomyces aurantiogriseus]|uniref:Uncharacterized protein n=1 Tax=Streptomyces aurantiogriseus TaxID=66870 RepID=A0A918FJS6_9ACTN|nr:hypothetical protein GCM10010251_70110 [Streptomyces aurantiogriseus]